MFIRINAFKNDINIPPHLFSDGYRFVLFDVTSLFTSILLRKTVDVILKCIYTDKQIQTGLQKRALKKTNYTKTVVLKRLFSLTVNFGIVQNMDWTGLDWTVGLDNWTGQLDWTIGLDSWTGLLDWTVGLDYWTGFRMGFFPLNRRNLTDSKVYGMFLRKTK